MTSRSTTARSFRSDSFYILTKLPRARNPDNYKRLLTQWFEFGCMLEWVRNELFYTVPASWFYHGQKKSKLILGTVIKLRIIETWVSWNILTSCSIIVRKPDRAPMFLDIQKSILEALWSTTSTRHCRAMGKLYDETFQFSELCTTKS